MRQGRCSESEVPRRNFSEEPRETTSRWEKPPTPKTKFGWYQLRCRGAQGPMTGPHTQDMTCAHLSMRADLRTGNQEKCHCHHM